MENDDTDLGGNELSIEQAASAFAKSTSQGTCNREPERNNEEQGDQADDELLESDQEDGEEAEGEADDEEQSEDDENAEPESEGGRFVASNGNVKLPDGTVTTVAELIDGNLRQSDYTLKTTQLREKERQAEERISAITASEKQVNEQREFISQLLQAFAPQPPDPSMMDQNSQSYDPFGYLSAKDQFDRMVGLQNHVAQQMQMSRQQADQKQAGDRNEKAAKEWETLQEKFPELRTPAKAEAFASSLAKTGSAYGFTQEELAGALPYDHRFALVLRDADKWRKLQANKPKAVEKVQGRPPVQKSGKRLTPDAQRARRSEDAVNRLKQSGSVEDAALAYLASRKG